MDHTNLIEYWALEGNMDGVKNGRDGTATSGVVLSSGGGVWGDDCYQFVSDDVIYVSASQSAIFKVDEGTVVCWVKPTQVASGTRMIFGMAYGDKGTWDNPWTSLMVAHYGQGVYGHTNYGGHVGSPPYNYQNTGVSDPVLNTTNWHMLAFTNDNERIKSYRGYGGSVTLLKDVALTVEDVIHYGTNPELCIGARCRNSAGDAALSGENFSGYMAECKF